MPSWGESQEGRKSRTLFGWAADAARVFVVKNVSCGKLGVSRWRPATKSGQKSSSMQLTPCVADVKTMRIPLSARATEGARPRYGPPRVARRAHADASPSSPSRPRTAPLRHSPAHAVLKFGGRTQWTSPCATRRVAEPRGFGQWPRGRLAHRAARRQASTVSAFILRLVQRGAVAARISADATNGAPC